MIRAGKPDQSLQQGPGLSQATSPRSVRSVTLPMTTYLSFTPAGGRIGRIAWSNGDEDTWGSVRWDRWWPRQPFTPTQLAQAVAAIQQAGIAMAKALMPAAQRATNAIKAFGAAMAKAAQEETKPDPHT